MNLPTLSGEFEITPILQQAWRIRYPAVDLAREYPLMVLWLTKNPARRPKSPKSAPRFVERWIKTEQSRAERNLAEESLRGQKTAAIVGQLHGVTARPGESQEHFNRRVVAAAGLSIVKRA